MFRISAASVMMYQAMMEAIINDSLETETKLSQIDKSNSFSEKWTKALVAVGKENGSFKQYHESIYKKFRIPMTHPKKAKIATLDELSFSVLLSGYKDGWKAYAELCEGLGHPHDDGSWELMCETYMTTPSYLDTLDPSVVKKV